jgi:hypothetical protein
MRVVSLKEAQIVLQKKSLAPKKVARINTNGRLYGLKLGCL